ncbi:hypothetical protein TSAR_015586 [Trichomalopsis sarcophagae]|uniref:C2H2-type domain-containing protein n=1 Tax=Trichomalopsis sarcophagae TaxID=543379 RepID=A0A232EW03_9HYME|nr:hypothetical protein TSAR_015586 [Trichomalopsis sarcophagae]
MVLSNQEVRLIIDNEQPSSDGLKDFTQHFTMYHSINVTKGIPDTGFICGQNGCQSNFVHFRNLRRHILNNHLAEANLATAAADDEVNAVEMDENMEYNNNDMLENHEMEAEAFNNMARNIVNAPLDLRSYIVKMICKLHSDSSMTGSAITRFLNHSENLLSIYSNSLKDEINAQLVQHLVNNEIIRDVNKVFDNENPFLDLKAFEKQMKALNENSDYIDPIEIPLGRRIPDTGFICGQNGCQSNFVHFRNLRRHILNNHLAEANLATAAADDEVNAVEMNENMEYDNNDILEHHEMEAEAFNNMARDIVNAPLDLQSYIVKMICKLHSDSSMTGSAITRFLNHSENLLSMYSSSLKDEINAQLVQHLVNNEIIRDVNKVFDNENPFLDLKAFEKQMKALNENSDYIDPIEIPLGRRVDSRLNKTTLSYISKEVVESYQYVPVIKV